MYVFQDSNIFFTQFQVNSDSGARVAAQPSPAAGDDADPLGLSSGDPPPRARRPHPRQPRAPHRPPAAAQLSTALQLRTAVLNSTNDGAPPLIPFLLCAKDRKFR